ncbi:MAG: Flp pilus assembly complex ATPase component TadA [Phycisphaerales bacterium]|nr:Flp pilus assembly complex ATPase component TadA [Phycisphaerales bacterium]MCB9837273.1 Flp pilus assembly complex ATPase component TadA [Phycisphaera sp.]
MAKAELGQVDYAQLKGHKLGRILRKLGTVKKEQVHEALEIQKAGRKVPIGQLLVELGFITQRDVNEGLAAQAGMAYVDLEGVELPQNAIDAIPAANVRVFGVVPLEYNERAKRLKIAMKNANNFRAVDDIRLLLGVTVEAVVGDADIIDKLIEKHFAKAESMTDVVSDLAKDDKFTSLAGDQSIDLEAVLEAAEDNKIVKLLNLVLMQAIKDKASDIHFEPFEDEFKMRYRIDGVLYEMVPPPAHLGTAITSRVKVMANLDIAERRLPQDGRIALTIGESAVDLRVAVLPTMHGESVVMRLLDRSNVELSLDRVGLDEKDLTDVRYLINRPNGIVIVTGPTGSGKTTTLYAALAELNDIETKILTAEDPVEYDIDGLCQVQVNPEVGLTFPAALRSFLRQDPDVILVGEIRDKPTAEISVQASLTGHLVLSTLHTNDAPSSIVRLIDLGLERFLLAATIEGVVAQRLVRTICPKCREAYVPGDEELMELALTQEMVQGKQFMRGRGCDNCHGSGYKGRMGIFEIMMLDDESRELILKEASTSALRNHSKAQGMRTLRESGLRGIYDGRTTIDEVVRETIAEE